MEMTVFANPVQWVLGLMILISSLGVILSKKPVYSGIFFLVALLTLSVIYVHLSAEFIAVMQMLVYAGAILVIFMFVIILFQDAHSQISLYTAQSLKGFLIATGVAFCGALAVLGSKVVNIFSYQMGLPKEFGSVQSLGKILYINFFFPFEAVIFIFLIAMIGAFYIGKKEK